MSIPLSVSPISPAQELSTLSIAHATTIAMMALLNITQNIKISQPTGLKPSHVEVDEGRLVTNTLSKGLKVPRTLSPAQERMRRKKMEKERFEREWDLAAQKVKERKTRLEGNWEIEDDNWEGWDESTKFQHRNELIPGKMGAHTPKPF